MTSSATADATGEALHSLVAKLYPLCRSITGNGVRRTLDLIGEHIPLEVFEVPSGTAVFDWRVPKEWNVAAASISDAGGRRVVDFAHHNLHLVSYSVPVRARMSLRDLRPHLHSLPDRPSWIPYRTSYYRESWGFCLADDVLRSLPDGEYDVVVDTTLENGSLTYAECVVPGDLDDEVLIYTHTCHPSLANDNASGLALTTLLAERMLATRPRLSYRFVFGPGTIGSITWLAQNEDKVRRIRHGLVIGLVGDPAEIGYKCSRNGRHAIDRAARHVLRDRPDARIVDFSPYGYDERQFCSPGFDLAVGRLSRSSEGGYPEYHTSADDLTLVRPAALADSFSVASRILGVVDRNASYENLAPHCEPQLGKRGLYRATGGENLPSRELALLWVLNQSDGAHSLLDIAERSGLPFETISSAAGELETAALLREVRSRAEISPGGHA